MISLANLTKRFIVATKRMIYQDDHWTDHGSSKGLPQGQSSIVTSGYGNSNSYGGQRMIYGGSSFSSWQKCEHEQRKEFEPVFQTPNGLYFYGAAKSDIPSLDPDDDKRLVVNCSGYSINGTTSGPFVKAVPETMKALQNSKLQLKGKKVGYGDEILLDWDDGKAPYLVPGFWTLLLDLAAADKYVDVMLCCFGGHGRTGTGLAAVLLASGMAKNPDDAIALVRKKHCSKAVESYDQIDYLEILASYLHKWKSDKDDGHCHTKPSK